MPFSQLPLYRRIHWINVAFLSSTFLASVTLVPWYLFAFGGSWQLVALFLFCSSISMLCITGGYHRYLSHRSYEMRPWLKAVVLVLGAGAFQGPALQWCSDHRRHHRFVDSPDDPHNIHEGFLWAHIGWLFVKEDPDKASPYPRDLSNDRLVAWQHRHFVPLAFFVGFGLPTLLGALWGQPVGGFLIGGVLKVVVTNHCTYFINSLAHTLGERPYSEKHTARDSFLMAMLAFGEGYHNYHHRFQADYRNGVRWYQWDPTKWLIKSLSWLGWTYQLRKASAHEILRARLQTDASRLLQLGVKPERLLALKQRVEEAQAKWRQRYEDYREHKRSRKGAYLLELKAEMKLARLEYKLSRAQWGVFRRTMRALPATA